MTSRNPITDLQELAMRAMLAELGTISGLAKTKIWEPWHLSLWQHLIPEFVVSYKALIASCQQKDLSASAWMTRSLLELTVWVVYCVGSRDNAKRFYDDKARDAFDLLDHLKLFAALADKPDTTLSDLIDTTREALVDRLPAEGYEDIDETYQKVHHAAKQLGLGPFFKNTNKLLSKFAHPTAMMVFSFPDEDSRAQASKFSLVLGTVLCVSSMAEFDRYANTVGGTTSKSDADKWMSELGLKASLLRGDHRNTE